MDFFMLECFFDIFNIPILVCKGNRVLFHLPKESYSRQTNQKWLLELVKVAQRKKMPFFLLEDNMIYYGIFQDVEDNCFAFGPVARKTVEKERLAAYYHKYKIKSKYNIQKCSLDVLAKVLIAAFYHYTGKKIAKQDIWVESKEEVIRNWRTEEDFEHYQLFQSEEECSHNSIVYENQILQIVKNGDTEAIKELMNKDGLDMDNIGMVAIDTLKQQEYLTVSFITLIVRAAIAGGMNPDDAYGKGDVYLQKLECCQKIEEIVLLGIKAQVDFTNCVKIAKEQRNKLAYIEECKDYIAKHLRKPFKIGEIAEAVGVDRSYLSKKFSDTEGMTIQQYVMKERCNHAANLLKYSDHPISIISEYFCFSSQSHFGKQFKGIFGMTPNEYRNQNRYIESSGQN